MEVALFRSHSGGALQQQLPVPDFRAPGSRTAGIGAGKRRRISVLGSSLLAEISALSFADTLWRLPSKVQAHVDAEPLISLNNEERPLQEWFASSECSRLAPSTRYHAILKW